MSKNDRKFEVKRRERIDDIFEKDITMAKMKEDGFTHMLPTNIKQIYWMFNIDDSFISKEEKDLNTTDVLIMH